VTARPPVPDPLLPFRLLEAMPEPAAVLDGTGRVVLANAGLAALAGRPAPALTGHPLGAFLPELPQPLAAAFEVRHARSGRAFAGRSFPCQGHVVLVLTEVTPLAAARDEAEKARQELASAHALAGMTTWEWDVATSTVRWSDAVYGLMRLDPATTRPSMDLFEALLHPDDRARVREAIAAALERDEPYALEMRFVRADGAVLWGYARGHVERDAAGRPVRMRGTVQDVTPLRQRDGEITEWRARYEAAVRASGQALYDWDTATGRITWAPTLPDVLGWQPAQLADLAQYRAIIHPADLAGFDAEIDRVVRARAPLRLRYRMRHRDGHFVTVEDRGDFFLDRSGELVRMLGLVRDVTAEVEAESQRSSLAAILQGLIEGSRDAVAVVDDGLRHVLWNEAYADAVARFHGTQVRAGMPVADLLPAGSPVREATLAAWHRVLAGERLTAVRELRPLDGSGPRVVETRFSPILGPGQAVRGGFCIAHDITAEARSAAALRESEVRFRTLAEGAPLGIFLVDPEGRMTYHNARLAELWGLTDAAIAAGAWGDLVVAEDRALVTEEWAAALRRGRPFFAEFRVRAPDGALRWLRGRSVPLHPDGRATTHVGTVEDITERRLALDALRESEERFRLLSDAAPLGIFLMNPEGRVTYANPQLLAIMDETPDMIGTGVWVSRVHPDDRPGVVSQWQTMIAGGTAAAHEFRVVRRDGTVRWVRLSSRPIHQDGAIVSHVGMIEDSTERVETLASLRQSEERFRRLADTAPLAIFVLSPGGQPTYANPRFYALWQIEPGMGLDAAFARVAPDDAARITAHWRDLIGRGAEGTDEFRLLRPDGTTRWIHIYLTPLRGADGTLRGFVGTADDITERAEREQALAASEERFRTLVSASPVGVFIADETGSITYGNPRLVELFGAAERDLLGHGFTRFLHPDDAARVTAHWQQAIRQHTKTSLEFRVCRADGEVRDVRSHSAPLLDSDGWIRGRVGVLEDITEARRLEQARRDLEAQVQHAQKLESLGVLAGGIAHDFNNLLVGILGNASLALLDLPPSSPVAEPVRDIERAAMRAADLTRQLLAYAGRGRFVIRPVDVSDLVRDMAGLVQAAISKRAALRFDLATGLPAVQADATQLRQVVMNLITNASDALGAGNGVITVRTAESDVDEATIAGAVVAEQVRPGRHVVIEVSDTGCGMDAATLARIFDPFFTTKFTGRGLGLAATLGIVRGHRGMLHVASRVGEGTTFRVAFPVSSQPVAPEPEAAGGGQATPWRGSGLVLVVDDDPRVRRVARSLLERRGFEVAEAEDGAAGITAFAREHARLRAVLLDLTMPHLSGPEALRELRRIDPRVPVVLTSGYDQQDVAAAVEGREAAGFLSKPFGASEFYAELRRVLEG